MNQDALPGTTPTRLDGIDALRGLVIVLMVMDHAREYSAGTGSVTDPMTLGETGHLLFWMRWLTHFCAPVFTLLAGVSAGLQSMRMDRPTLARHLAVRGLVLIILEFTVIHFAWTFSFVWPRFYAQVIWALGVSMLALAAALALPPRVRLALGAVIVLGHNLLDGWHPREPAVLHWLWAILHDRQVMPLFGGLEVRTSYPVLPMIGMILLGDALGRWFLTERSAAARQRVLVTLGSAVIALFLVLRLTNVYGDPTPAAYDGGLTEGLRSLLNVTKYPMSLSFTLMTLGPALLLLAAWDRAVPAVARPLTLLGRVPMFLYITHLYLLHAGAILAALALGSPWSAFDFRARIFGLPADFGFPLWLTIPITLATVAVLYPAARWYAALRASRRVALTRYL